MIRPRPPRGVSGNRGTNGQTDRQTDRQTNRRTEEHRHRLKPTLTLRASGGLTYELMASLDCLHDNGTGPDKFIISFSFYFFVYSVW